MPLPVLLTPLHAALHLRNWHCQQSVPKCFDMHANTFFSGGWRLFGREGGNDCELLQRREDATGVGLTGVGASWPHGPTDPC